jgi:hypothetical protein
MLHRAAAAHAEMSADRGDALCTRLLDLDKTPTIGATRLGIDVDGFARQAPGDVNRSFGALSYSIAVLAQTPDQKLFNHARPR